MLGSRADVRSVPGALPAGSDGVSRLVCGPLPSRRAGRLRGGRLTLGPDGRKLPVLGAHAAAHAADLYLRTPHRHWPAPGIHH